MDKLYPFCGGLTTAACVSQACLDERAQTPRIVPGLNVHDIFQLVNLCVWPLISGESGYNETQEGDGEPHAAKLSEVREMTRQQLGSRAPFKRRRAWASSELLGPGGRRDGVDAHKAQRLPL
jgi:hypothetical protein